MKLVGTASALSVAGQLSCAQKAAGPAPRPNVLFILVDQLRFDAFSYMNNPVVKTPHIDQLAAEGAVFAQATCSSPLCGPSRACLLSGRYSKNKVYEFRNSEVSGPGIWKESLETSDEVLAKNGYTVAYHGKWHVGKDHTACYQGGLPYYLGQYKSYLDERYSPPSGPEYRTDRYTHWPYRPLSVDRMMAEALKKGHSMPHHNEAGIIDVEDQDTLTAWTVQQTIDFLNAQTPDKPFAVTCSILHPHSPLLANSRYATMFDPKEMPLPDNLYVEGNYIQALRNNRPSAIPEILTPDEDGLKLFISLYYGLVKELDDQLGRLLQALEASGRAEDTLVVFTADHGELMGSHKTISKMEFFEECLRVPLIFRYPRRIPKGKRIETPAAGVDVAATILDYCGLQPPVPLDGISLRGVIDGKEPGREFAYSELGPSKCIRSQQWKYIQGPDGKEILFQLKQDPLENTNLLVVTLTEEQTPLLEQLRAELKRQGQA